MIRVTVWNEYCHEQEEERIRNVYPKGIHSAIAEFLGTNEDIQVITATLYDENLQLRPDAGITDELLANTDVMFWWGHVRHGEVPDEIAIKVKEAVLSGMGMVFLHSAHHSKPFKLLMGTTCNLGWKDFGFLTTTTQLWQMSRVDSSSLRARKHIQSHSVSLTQTSFF